MIPQAYSARTVRQEAKGGRKRARAVICGRRGHGCRPSGASSRERPVPAAAGPGPPHPPPRHPPARGDTERSFVPRRPGLRGQSLEGAADARVGGRTLPAGHRDPRESSGRNDNGLFSLAPGARRLEPTRDARPPSSLLLPTFSDPRRFSRRSSAGTTPAGTRAGYSRTLEGAVTPPFGLKDQASPGVRLTGGRWTTAQRPPPGEKTRQRSAARHGRHSPESLQWLRSSERRCSIRPSSPGIAPAGSNSRG